MITKEEILGKTKWESLALDVKLNINTLIDRVNKIRLAWGKPMQVTSGFRSMEDHLRIYKEKGITDPKRIPMKSKHLTGQAVDVYDPKLELTQWLKDNPKQLEDAQLWCEQGNKNWVHFQSLPPMSGVRWFLP